MIAGGQMRLYGVCIGHYEHSDGNVNMGMSMVVPIQRVAEILDGEHVREMQEGWEQAHLDRQASP